MTNSSSDDVFTLMTDLGKSAEPEMRKFLLKGVRSEFQDLIMWQTETGGKRLRPALTILFAQAFGASTNAQEVLAAAAGIELIHSYSLILDDIIDRGELRRGQPTVRTKYGDEFAILAGIIYREAVYEAAKATGEFFNEVITLYSETIRKLVEGERLDILFEQNDLRTHEYFLSNRYHTVTLEDYQEMIAGKTASLIAAACKLGAIVGGASSDEQAAAEKFGWSAGIAFQIADDYLDIFAVSDKFGKKVYKDIIEQKLGNFVCVQTIRALDNDEAKQFQEYLQDSSLLDEDRIKNCVPLIEKAKVKENVMKEAEKWAQEAKMALKTLKFKKEENKTVLEKLAEFTVRRAY
ncbi:MAG: polyprenyl synthetase family protein [Candidatus Heimdallarchaeota archaeon]|nr:MAG: polyprenyl synthetase family protein [Candidatus Heimdallarchaeota archaeon]